LYFTFLIGGFVRWGTAGAQNSVKINYYSASSCSYGEILWRVFVLGKIVRTGILCSPNIEKAILKLLTRCKRKLHRFCPNSKI